MHAWAGLDGCESATSEEYINLHVSVCTEQTLDAWCGEGVSDTVWRGIGCLYLESVRLKRRKGFVCALGLTRRAVGAVCVCPRVEDGCQSLGVPHGMRLDSAGIRLCVPPEKLRGDEAGIIECHAQLAVHP